MATHETFASIYWSVEPKVRVMGMVMDMVRVRVIFKFMVIVSVKDMVMVNVMGQVHFMEWFAMTAVLYTGVLRPVSCSWAGSFSRSRSLSRSKLWTNSWSESQLWSISSSWSLSWSRAVSWRGDIS